MSIDRDFWRNRLKDFLGDKNHMIKESQEIVNRKRRDYCSFFGYKIIEDRRKIEYFSHYSVDIVVKDIVKKIENDERILRPFNGYLVTKETILFKLHRFSYIYNHKHMNVKKEYAIQVLKDEVKSAMEIYKEKKEGYTELSYGIAWLDYFKVLEQVISYHIDLVYPLGISSTLYYTGADLLLAGEYDIFIDLEQFLESMFKYSFLQYHNVKISHPKYYVIGSSDYLNYLTKELRDRGYSVYIDSDSHLKTNAEREVVEKLISKNISSFRLESVLPSGKYDRFRYIGDLKYAKYTIGKFNKDGVNNVRLDVYNNELIVPQGMHPSSTKNISYLYVGSIQY